jgi:hypothetical protein
MGKGVNHIEEEEDGDDEEEELEEEIADEIVQDSSKMIDELKLKEKIGESSFASNSDEVNESEDELLLNNSLSNNNDNNDKKKKLKNSSRSRSCSMSSLGSASVVGVANNGADGNGKEEMDEEFDLEQENEDIDEELMASGKKAIEGCFGEEDMDNEFEDDELDETEYGDVEVKKERMEKASDG